MDLGAAIPNNVGLADNPRLLAMLEAFGGKYMAWWRDWGPQGFDATDIWLRRPLSIEAGGWADFDYMRLPDYRFGVYQTPAEPERRAGFGAIAGAPVFDDIPDEFRRIMLKLLVIQGDTEPASVEQSRLLGAGIPSLYDLRNLFQINVEEGRHLWAMVHLLFVYFGKDGEIESEGLLERRCGSAEKPRLLDAFNYAIDEYLSFLFWSTFADRDGKFQLLAMSESALDPLARTCKFMLTEEGFHMFVGDDGLSRVVRRTAELMRDHDTDDVAPHGGVNLETFQRYINFWAPRTIDLFGNERSDWSETLFDAGLKGRAYEGRLFDEHVALDQPVTLEEVAGGTVRRTEVPARKALNEVLRETYLGECQGPIERWNRELARFAIDFRFRMPSKRFNRRIGAYAGHRFTPDGDPVDAESFAAGMAGWLPSDAERAHVKSLMQPVLEPGRIAGWIAPPSRGIKGKPPLDFDYVRL